MKLYGTLDMQDNLIVNLTLDVEQAFPETPKEGRLVFYNNVLYICVLVGGDPAWIPLTNELQTLVFTMSTPSDVWEVPHNYGTLDVMAQAYDQDNKTIIPDEIEISDTNNVVFRFTQPMTGKAVVIAKRSIS